MRAVLSVLVLLGLTTPAFALEIPEPGSLALVALGVGAALWFGRKKR